MKPYLTNTCEYNEANLTEALEAQIRETQRLRNWILGVFSGGVLLYSAYRMLIRGEAKYQLPTLLCVLMVCLLVYTNIGMPRRAAKAQVARIREANGGLCFRFEFREEELLLWPPRSEESAPIGYAVLGKLLQTKRLDLIFTNDKRMLVLDRAGFKHGIEADFWKLMNEACPAAVPKKLRQDQGKPQ